MEILTSKQIYDRLITAYGQPDWWPGTPYAIMVTAILVQNTAWSNVEKTVAEMGERLTPEYIDSLTEEELQPLIRSCGFYRAKARYVKALTAWFKGYGYEVGRVREKSLHEVRQELLALPGIGAETADAIFIFVFRMPSFVLDAYTRRFLERLMVLRRMMREECFPDKRDGAWCRYVRLVPLGTVGALQVTVREEGEVR